MREKTPRRNLVSDGPDRYDEDVPETRGHAAFEESEETPEGKKYEDYDNFFMHRRGGLTVKMQGHWPTAW